MVDALSVKNRRTAVIRRILVTVGCAVFFPFYYYLSTRDESVPHDYRFLLPIVFLVTVSAVQLGYFLVKLWRKNRYYGAVNNWLENNSLELWLQGKGNRKFFWFCMIVLMVAWIPAFLAFYPGTFGYDAIPQVLMYYGHRRMSAFQPYVHSWIMGFIFKTASDLSGSYAIGLASYIVFQMITVTSGAARSFAYLSRKKVPVLFLLVSLVAFAFNPFFQTLTMATTKDVPFAGVLLHFLVGFLELLDAGTAGAKFRDVVELLFTGFLVCELRNQCIYIVAVMVVITLIACRKKLIVPVTMILICVLTLGFNAWAYRTYDIKKTDMREMLNVPIQQSYRVAYDKLTGKEPADITDEEMAMLVRLVPEENIYNYRGDISDPVKFNFDTQSFKANEKEYIQLWYDLGKKNTKIYWYAFRDLLAPYWNYNIFLQRGLMFLYTNQEDDIWNIQRDSKNPEYIDYLIEQNVNLRYQDNPVTFLLFEPGICLWIMTFAFGWAIINRRRRQTLLTFWICLLFGTMMLGPAALYRYIFPIELAVPLMLGMFWIERRPENAEAGAPVIAVAAETELPAEETIAQAAEETEEVSSTLSDTHPEDVIG